MESDIQRKIKKIDNLKLETYGDDILSAIKNKFVEMYWEIATLDEIITRIRESRTYDEDFSTDGYECLDYYRSLPVSLMQYIEDCEYESASYYRDVNSCYVRPVKTRNILDEVKKYIEENEEND